MALRSVEPGTSYADLSTGERLAIHRRRIGLTQRQMAIVLGVGIRTVQRWEKDRLLPTGGQLKRLCRSLGLSADYLLGLKATPPKLSRNARRVVASFRDAPGRSTHLAFVADVRRPNPQGGRASPQRRAS